MWTIERLNEDTERQINIKNEIMESAIANFPPLNLDLNLDLFFSLLIWIYLKIISFFVQLLESTSGCVGPGTGRVTSL